MSPATHHAFRLERMYGCVQPCRKWGAVKFRREGVSSALRYARRFPGILRGSLGLRLHEAMQEPIGCGAQRVAA